MSRPSKDLCDCGAGGGRRPRPGLAARGLGAAEAAEENIVSSIGEAEIIRGVNSEPAAPKAPKPPAPKKFKHAKHEDKNEKTNEENKTNESKTNTNF